MSSRLASSMIVVGAIFAFAGLCFLPAALTDHGEGNLLGVGAVVFALGTVVIAGGIYLKAQMLQSDPNAKNAAPATTAAEKPTRRLKGGCDLCGTEAPVVQCKVHQLHLCGSCLAAHYDARSCAYTPTSRRPVTKTGKAMAAKARS
jgi:hypothetical protein